MQKNKVFIDSKGVDKKELESYYRQEPNRRFLLIFKFHLAAYNFSKMGKTRKWKKWIERVIGEEPSIYDSVLVSQTSEQFVKYLKNEAYYDANVKYNVQLKRKRARVSYYIETKSPVIVNSLSYQIDDTNLHDIIFNDTINRLIRKGNRMTLESLQGERNRIVTQLKDSGYYEFTDKYIRYKIDTLNHKANIKLVLDQIKVQDSLLSITKIPHKQYWINKVYFIPDFDPKLAIKMGRTYFQMFDTTYHEGFGFIYSGEQNVKPKVILKANAIKPGDKYNYSKVNSTTRYFNSLKLFRLNNMGFYRDADIDSLINCVVQLSPSVYQNYSVNFETTHTGGNFGLGGYFNYQHKNLFHGAEILNVKVSGSLQRQTESADVDAFNIFEYGAESSLETPSFILPFKLERFYKKYNPKTNFTVAYSYQQRPDYTRTISSGSMGYNWRGTATTRHYVSPIDIGLVAVNVINQDYFDEYIKGTFLENNYKDYLIAGGTYSFIYQNKAKALGRNFSYYRMNVGVAGNLLHFSHDKLGLKKIEAGGYYTMFGQQYAQYVLSNLDYRYNIIVNKDNSIVSRAYAGFAYPYGNSKAMPFIKQYYAGGAEGIRAWHPRALGPGSYVVPDSIKNVQGYYPNLLGDIKLEFNMEYRYSFNKSWKGAFFVDVGNVWLHKYDENRVGAEFKFDRFYKQFAIGTGFGVRFDMEFAVFRVDYGFKVRDPGLSGKESWVMFNGPVNIKDLYVWHFAVGYPF